MSSLGPITSNSSSIYVNSNPMNVDFTASSTVSKVQTAVAEVRKGKPTQTIESRKLHKTAPFTFPARRGSDILGAKLGRKATADELLNFQMDRKLNAKINKNDPEIPVGYLINWKLLKDLRKKGLNIDIHLDAPVCREALRDHLNASPTPLQSLNCNLLCKPADLGNPDYKKLDIPPTISSTWKKIAIYSLAPLWKK